MKVTIEKFEDNPCGSCKFAGECRWAREYEVEDCKDWAAKEEEDN